ncbi:methylglyoxal synthase [Terrihabitans soli]|uniref:Methylglyoxal synthase n=1 Tax=Terrihabitans soli TaxID=708113 RepID=A0A6S6QNF2_9HYPH|nr:methylglyoxal synthase [Terrihabitans soli]BCJ92044.1 methylglyoxal synthase [Terrihabitans soli]
MARPRLALIAHDLKKDDLVDWVGTHEKQVALFDIVATGTTGTRILERCPELPVTRVKSGPLGGDQQIGAMIAEGKIHGVIFFVDPLTPMPHDVDVKALTRLATLYDIPIALNRATADLMVKGYNP